MSTLIRNDVTREFFEGPMINALPDPMETYRLDFYFMPRATEDFFRGRTTVAIGGVSFDRFEFKYINDVQAYRSNTPYQTLELNGILYLNDEAPLGLHNLKYVGHGIIYNSPMIGGGKVVIGGDLVGVDIELTGFVGERGLCLAEQLGGLDGNGRLGVGEEILDLIHVITSFCFVVFWFFENKKDKLFAKDIEIHNFSIVF